TRLLDLPTNTRPSYMEGLPSLLGPPFRPGSKHAFIPTGAPAPAPYRPRPGRPHSAQILTPGTVAAVPDGTGRTHDQHERAASTALSCREERPTGRPVGKAHGCLFRRRSRRGDPQTHRNTSPPDLCPGPGVVCESSRSHRPVGPGHHRPGGRSLPR